MVKGFSCHSAILSLASPKLDLLIKKASGELLLPHLNPEHWCLFYKCISPDNNGAFLSEGESIIFNDFERVKYLVPFLKGFGMQNYLNFSIEMVLDEVHYQRERLEDVGDDADELKETVNRMQEILQFAVDHDMEEVTRMQEENLPRLFRDRSKFYVIGNLDYKTMQGLVSLCLTIRRTNPEESFSSESCPLFWAGMRTGIGNKLEGLTRNKYDSSEVELLTLTVQLSFRLSHLES
jgi:hypothetical protein